MCKHYYIEGQRIASKIGGGFAPAIADIEIPVRDPLFGEDYSNISSDLLNMCFRSDECAGMNPQFISYNTGLRCIKKIQGEDREEKNLFFYHSDHIGSSSFVTDRTGIASQHLQYLPFGELFVEQQTLTNYSTPYKFSGKEKDEETSYSYFGARYYMSDVSVWLSVDPLAEETPGWTPYRYCFQNPIMLIDPDGRSEGNPDEWNYNVETGETKWVSPKGGTETQHVNFVNNNGNKLTSVAVPGLNSEVMNYLGYGLSGGSIATSSALSLNSYVSKLLDNGKFFATYKGNPYEWSMNFFGNKSVPSGLVAAQKTRFTNGVKVLSWPGFKYFGTGFSILGTSVSAMQFAGTNDPGLKFEYGFDTGMGLVGFGGLGGAAVSGLHFGTKPLIKLNAPYISSATSGFSEFGMGFHSINLMPTK